MMVEDLRMSDSSQNPFADRPQTAADNVQTYQGFSLRGVPSTVQQVRVSSSLQIMVGGLELLPAAYLLVLAGIVGSSFFKTNELPAGLGNRPIQIFLLTRPFCLGVLRSLSSPYSVFGRELPGSNSNDARCPSLHPFWESPQL